MTVNLLDFDAAGLAALFAEMGEKPFRARQVLRWMHRFGQSDFDAMTDLAKSLREKLKSSASIMPPGIVSDKLSDDGTRKFLFDVGGGNAVVTVSTSGVVPAMDRLREECPVALAVSLHAPSDALRDELVPINRKYPLRELMAACLRYLEKAPRDFVTFEYVMLDGINDSESQAKELLALTRDVPCKFNLIPFNPFPASPYRRSPSQRIRNFAEILMNAGVVTTTRKTRGDDIDAACGQLAGQVLDKTRRKMGRIIDIHEARS